MEVGSGNGEEGGGRGRCIIIHLFPLRLHHEVCLVNTTRTIEAAAAIMIHGGLQPLSLRGSELCKGSPLQAIAFLHGRPPSYMTAHFVGPAWAELPACPAWDAGWGAVCLSEL